MHKDTKHHSPFHFEISKFSALASMPTSEIRPEITPREDKTIKYHHQRQWWQGWEISNSQQIKEKDAGERCVLKGIYGKTMQKKRGSFLKEMRGYQKQHLFFL